MDKRVVAAIVGISVLVIGGFLVFVTKSQNNNPSASKNTTAQAKDMKISDTDWVKGPANARVTLVEYGDFQCPACGAYYPLVKQLLQEHPNDVRLVFRHYPLTQIHKNAYYAAKAAEAAGKQGKFWEMYEKLFANQKAWGESDKATDMINEYAKNVSVDMTKFKADVANVAYEAKINDDVRLGDTFGITGTPTFFINGVKINLPGSYEALNQAVTNAINAAPTPKPESKIHEHADFALFVNGKKYNLSNAKYDEKDPNIHIHDADGTIVHKHSADVTIGTFFSSLGLATIKPTTLYVNGQKYESDWQGYVFKDLDRLALSTSELSASQLKLVADKACIYSEKCPERGKPPTETCVGGLGTPCEVGKKS